MATNEMTQYFRGDNNHTIGIMLAIHDETEDIVRIGWSKCNKKDNFNKEKGLKIARGRTLGGCSSREVPASREFIKQKMEHFKDTETGRIVEVPLDIVVPRLRKQYENFIERVVTYFKSVRPSNFIICSPVAERVKYAVLVTDTRNADLNRQQAKATTTV